MAASRSGGTGFIRCPPEAGGGADGPGTRLPLCSLRPTVSAPDLRDAGFLVLYRLLFILYAEARDKRLIGHPLYQRSYSLDSIVAKLLRTPPAALAANQSSLWPHLQAIFRIFNEGMATNLP